MATKQILEFILKAKNEASAKIKKLASDTKKASASMQKSLQKHSASMKKMAVGITAVAGVGVLAIKKFIGAANVQIRVEKQLDAVLESTGHAAGLSADELKKMASGLQDVTTVGDEAIIAGQNMLLTFKNIGKDVFPKVTEVMLDTATAMNNGMTPSAEMLKNQAIQLGKALNDPTVGLTALSRVGITFSEEQKTTIKRLQEMGDMAGAQAIILEELNSQFGGAARAQAQTFQGQIQQLTNTFGDFMEDIGKALIPMLEKLVKKLKAVVNWFMNLSDEQKKNIAKWTLIVTGIAAVLVPLSLLILALGPLITAIQGVSVALSFLAANPIVLTIAGIVALVAAIVFLVKNWDILRENIFFVLDKVGEKLNQWTQELVTNFVFVTTKVKEMVVGILETLQENTGFVIERIIVKIVELKDKFVGIFNAIRDVIFDIFSSIVSFVTGKIDFLKKKFEVITGWISKIKAAVSKVGGVVLGAVGVGGDDSEEEGGSGTIIAPPISNQQNSSVNQTFNVKVTGNNIASPEDAQDVANKTRETLVRDMQLQQLGASTV